MSRKADARVQPEAMEKKIPTARSAATRKTANGTMLPADVETEPKPANDKKKGKPSREERGYTKARGKKDDWKQFFQGSNDFKNPEPDFSEERLGKTDTEKDNEIEVVILNLHKR